MKPNAHRDNHELQRLIDQAFYVLELPGLRCSIQTSIELAHHQASTAQGEALPPGRIKELASRAHDAAHLRLLSAVAGLVGVRQAEADIEGRWEAIDDLVSAVNLMLAAVEVEHMPSTQRSTEPRTICGQCGRYRSEVTQ